MLFYIKNTQQIRKDKLRVKEHTVKIASKDMLTKERRKAQRLNIPIPVKFRRFGKKGTYRESNCQNISGSGIMLCLDLPVKKGDKFEMLIHLSGDPIPVETVVEVMWCKKNTQYRNKPFFNCGMKYVKIKPRDRERFVFLFCELMMEYCMSEKNTSL